MDRLKRAMHQRFDWSPPPGCPADLPLRMLEAGDARRLATQLSCHQDIAGDGAFSLAMIAEYQEALFTHGPWFYRRLFWETGLIGQVLYLEAEAAGVRATGIGCFFDDPVHRVFGLEGFAFQSLYHFTVGGPVDDPRLTTLAPYPARWLPAPKRLTQLLGERRQHDVEADRDALGRVRIGVDRMFEPRRKDQQRAAAHPDHDLIRHSRPSARPPAAVSPQPAVAGGGCATCALHPAPAPWPSSR